MSAESFFVHLLVEGIKNDPLPELFEQTSAFRQAFGYHWESDENGNALKILSITAAKASFFPASQLLFKLCTSLQSFATNLSLEVHHNIHPFDFGSFIDFFAWFYPFWEDSIACFNRDWGAFLISTDKYYKSRFFLRKHYYFKF